MTLPGGPGYPCLDTTALIHFNASGHLDVLGDWFERAFAPAAVLKSEIEDQLAAHPANKAILEASWLDMVTIEDPDVMANAAAIHQRYGREPGQDCGESEVVALAAHHGWCAILDDSQGQRAAEDYGAAHCSILTMVLLAAAHERIAPGDAWKLHCALEESRGRGYQALTADAAHRPIFQDCVARFRKIVTGQGLEWPASLALRGADTLVVKVRERTPP